VFLDIVMEKLDGYKVCRKLRKKDSMKNIPIIFVSSKNQPADKLWAKNQGGTDYITKPYQSNDIVDQIKRYL
jgi:twitching motility two-component system response regulator PilH